MKIKLYNLNPKRKMSTISLIRHTYTIIPLFAFIDGIVLLLSDENKRIGDKLAETIVVQEGENPINLSDLIKFIKFIKY